MNKTLIAAAVSAAVAAPVASADITVYGRVNNAIDLNDLSAKANSEASTDITTVASRFGLKGSTDLGNGLTVHGQYEFGTVSDRESNASSAANAVNDKNSPTDVRIATAGVSGSFGRIDVGNQWSAYQKTVGTLISPTYTLGAALYGTVGGGAFRASNTIQYSNSWGPVGAVLDIRLNDDASPETADEAEDLRGDGWGLGVTYQVTPSITLAAAYDVEDNNLKADNARVLTITPQAAISTPTDGDHGDGILANVVSDTATLQAAFDTFTKSSTSTAAEIAQAKLLRDRANSNTDVVSEETRLGISGRWDIGAGYWLNVGWQNTEKGGYNVTESLSAAVAGVDQDDDGDAGGPDDVNIGGFDVEADGSIDADATRTVTDGATDVDTYFIYGGGPIGQKTTWLLGYASGNNGLDTEAGLLGSSYGAGVATDDANQLVWGLYHNVGGGLRFYYEAISLEHDVRDNDDDRDGERHLLGIRVDF